MGAGQTKDVSSHDQGVYSTMQPLEFLPPADLEAIHQTSMKVLAQVGICFPEGQALDIFKKHGFRTDGEIVYFTEDQVFDAIKDVPEQFSIQARNPARKVRFGFHDPGVSL